MTCFNGIVIVKHRSELDKITDAQKVSEESYKVITRTEGEFILIYLGSILEKVWYLLIESSRIIFGYQFLEQFELLNYGESNTCFEGNWWWNLWHSFCLKWSDHDRQSVFPLGCHNHNCVGIIFCNRFLLHSLNISNVWLSIEMYHGLTIGFWIVGTYRNQHQFIFPKKRPL